MGRNTLKNKKKKTKNKVIPILLEPIGVEEFVDWLGEEHHKCPSYPNCDRNTDDCSLFSDDIKGIPKQFRL